MSSFNRIVAILGLLVFGGLFLVIVLAPDRVESTARSFVLGEVREKLEPVLQSKAGQRLQDAYRDWKAGRSGAEGDAVSDVAKQLAPIIQKLCHFSCDDRAALQSRVETQLREPLSAVAKARDKALAKAKAEFQAVIEKLRLDLMIFAGANVFVFALLLGTTFLGPQARKALVLPSFLLTVTTLAAAGVYVFGQNWFFTILFDSYMAYSYVGFVAAVSIFFLCVFRVRSGTEAEQLPDSRNRRPKEGVVANTAAEILSAAVSAGGAGTESAGAMTAGAEAVVGCAEAVVGAFLELIPAP